MKRLYILILSAIFFLNNQAVSQDFITAINVPNSLCANESFEFNYTATTNIAIGTPITTWLSDATGSFVGETQIDDGTDVADGTNIGFVYVTIPYTTVLSPTSSYRVRVKAGTLGSIDNGSNIVINCTTRDYYWIGGSGNWGDLSKWEYTVDYISAFPASELPTTNDNVYFDDTTFPSGGQLTVDVTAYCNDLYWFPVSAANNPVIVSQSSSSTYRLEISGDFILSNGVYYDIRTTYFYSDKYNIYLDFADNLSQADPNTWWKKRLYFYNNYSKHLYSDLLAGRVYIDQGDFYTNDFSLTLDTDITSYASNFYGSSSIFTAGQVNIYNNFDMSSSTIYLGRDVNNNNPRLGGSSGFYNNVTIEDGPSDIDNSLTFNNLTLINGGGLNLAGGTVQTVNNQLTIQGTSRSNSAVITSQQPGIQATIGLNGTLVSADYVSITDNFIDDGFLGTYSATNAVNGGGNSGWDFSTSPISSLEYYWVGGTGNWSDVANHWVTSADGGTTTTPASEGPGSIDNVNFNGISFPSGGTVTVDQNVFIQNMIWEAGSGLISPSIFADDIYEFTMYGDITLDDGVERNIRNLYLNSSKNTINMSLGDNAGGTGQIYFTGGGIINLNSEMINYGWLYFEDATFNSNNNNVTFYGIQYSSSLTVVNWGSSNLYMDYYLWKTNLATVDYGTSTLHIFRPNNNFSQIYSNHNFYNVEVNGIAQFHAVNSFNSLTVNPGGTLALGSGNTQTIGTTLNLNGTRSAFAKIETFDSGNGPINSILDATTATVTGDFVDIADNTVTPAQASPISGVLAIPDNNVGWNITALPPLNFYWIGGTGNWTDPAHWSYSDGGSANVDALTPGPIDNTIFTANSFPSGGTVTIDQAVTVNDVTWQTGSGANNPVFYSDYLNKLTVKGNFIMANGVSRQLSQVSFDSSNGLNQIFMADNTDPIGYFIFEGGGNWELTGDFITNWDVYFRDGTLITNDHSLRFSYGSIERDETTLNLGNSDVFVTYYLYVGATTPTISVGTSTFYFGDLNGNQTTSIAGESMIFNNVVIDGPIQMESSSTFNSLTANPGATLKLFANRTQTINNTLNLVGDRGSFITIESFDSGSPGNGIFDVTTATVTADFVDISDNTILPDATAISGIGNGNTPNWTIGPLPALDFYWIGGAGNWSDPAHWSETDGGVANIAGLIPGLVDNAIFTGNSFTSGGTVTIDQPTAVNNMTWTAGSGTTNPEIYGDWGTRFAITGNITMDDGVHRRIRQLVFDSSKGNVIIDLADNFQAQGNLTFEGGGIWELQSDIIQGNDVYFQNGTLNSNDFNIQIGGFYVYDNTTFNFGSSIINIDYRLYNGNNTPIWNDTNASFNFTNPNDTYLRGPFTITKAVVNGVLTFEDNINNTFVNLAANPGSRIKIFANSTQTVTDSLKLVGTRSDFVIVSSFDYGTPGNGIFDVTGAIVIADFVDISNNTILPSATAISGIGNGNTPNWTIGPLPAIDFYWIGGTGNWTDPAHWSETDGGVANIAGLIPGLIDNAIFTTNSFTLGGTITIDQSVTVNDVTWQTGSGATNPEIFGEYNNTLTILGNLTMDSGVTRRVYSLNIDSRNGTNQIDLADNYNAQGDIRFTGGGISDLLSDLSTTDYLVMLDATLNTNDHTLELRGLNIDSNNAIINLGSSIVSISRYFNNYNNGTLNAGTSTVQFDNQNGSKAYLRGSSLSFHNVVVSTPIEIENSNSYFSFTAKPGSAIEIFANSTQTVTDSLKLVGTRSDFVTVSSFDYGTPGNGIFDVTTATVTADFVDISNNTILPSATAISGIGNGNTPNWTIGPLPAIDFYWIGGTGNWTDPAHWSETDGGVANIAGLIPGLIDNAIFTTNSFTLGGTITIDQSVTVNDVTWQTGSGATNPEIFGEYNNTLTILGNLTMDSGVTRRVYSLNIDSRNGTNQIDLADNYNAQGDIRFTGGGISDLLSDLSTTDYLVMLDATLNTNDHTLELRGLNIDSNNAIINLGSSIVSISRYFNNYNNGTLNAGTSTVQFDNQNGSKAYLRGSSLSFHNVVVSTPIEIENSNSYFSFTAKPGSAIEIFANSTQTVTDSLKLIGSSSSFVTVSSFDYGTPGNGIFDVTGTVTADYVDLKDNTITPASIANNSLGSGSIIGWTITAPPAQNFYWINGSGLWSDVTHWQTSADGGTTFVNATSPPGTVDNVFFTSSSFPATNGRLEIDQPISITNMTWEAGSGNLNPEILANWDNPVRIKGDLTMANGVVRNMYDLRFDSSNGVNNITMADNFSAYGDIRFYGNGTWNLLDSLYCGASLFIQDGTLNTNNNPITVQFGLSIDSDQSIVNFGSSNIYLRDGFSNNTSAATLDFGTSVFHFDNDYGGNQYLNGSSSFNTVIFNNPINVNSDNSFVSLQINSGAVFKIFSGSTQTVTGSLNISGTRSSLVEIETFDYGTPGNGFIDATGATVTADYVGISNNSITPDATATNAIDNGNNTGWSYTPLSALDLYWIGGSGSFTDPTHWSYTDGGEANIDDFAPGTLDNAIFTTNSFPSIGQVTINQAVTINNMEWRAGSGTTNPEIYGDYNNTLTILGNLTMDSGVTRRVYGLRIDSRNGTNQVDLADNYNAQGDIRFTGGGTSELLSALATSDYLIVEGATLNTNGYSLDLWSLNFEGSNSILNLGSSNVYIKGYFNDYGNNVTLIAGTSTVYFQRSDDYGDFFGAINGYADAFAFNNVEITGNFQTEISNSYNSLVVHPGSTIQLFAGQTQTINNGGSLSLVGSRSGLISLEAFDYGTPGRGTFITTGATVTADFIKIKDNLIDNGLATNVLATNAVDLDNNIGWEYSAITSLDFYWINGAGNWSDTTHWSTTADGLTPATDPPGAVDNVFFTTASFPEGGALTFDVTPEVVDMTWEPGSGANFPTLSESGPNNQLIIHGSLQMADGVARNFYRLKFDSDDIGNTITMADNLYGFNDVDFSGSGEWTLQDSLATSYLNIRGGTLNTNNQPIRVEYQVYLGWENDGIINWGSSNIYLDRLYNDAQNLTFNEGTSTFIFRGLYGNTDTEISGYPLSFYGAEFSGRAVLNNSYTFNDVTLTEGTAFVLQAASTQTISNSLTAIGNRGQMIQILSSNAGGPSTINLNTLGGATLALEYAVIQDNILDNGDGDPLTEEVAVSSVDNGGNQGWDFLSSPLQPLNYYWVGGTGVWSDLSHWATEDNGTTKHVAPPGVIDNVFFTASSFPSSGTLTLDQPAACNDMTWTDGSFSPTISGNFENRLTIRGNLSIANGVNRNLEYIEFNSTTDNLIILGDNRYENFSEFIFRGSGSWSLIDSLAATNIEIFSGTLNTLDNPVNLSSDFRLSGQGPVGLNLGSSNFRTRSISNYVASNNVIADMGTSNMIMTNGGFLEGNPMGFYDLTIEDHTRIWYTDIDVSNELSLLPGAVFELSPYNQLTVGSLNAVGTRPLPVTIKSLEDGNQATISSAGSITASDIVLQDNNATGGAVFNATEAIDNGNVTGWNLTPISPINFYWTGGSGDWSDITHWQESNDGGVTFIPASFAPGTVDNVFVDALLTSPATINLDYPAECNDMTWLSGLSGSAISGDNSTPLTIHGSLTLSSGVNNDLAELIFDSNETGNTINMADNVGNQFGRMTFLGIGDWTLTDSLNAYNLSMQGGATLKTNGLPLSVEYLGLDGNGAGNLNLGSSKVYLNILDGSPDNTSLTPGTSTISFKEGGQIYNSWTFNNVELDGEMLISENNTFNELSLNPGTVLTIGEEDTLTVSKLVADGERSRPISIKSSQQGVQSTILQASGSVNASYLTLQDNNATGGAFFIAQNSIDNGNNDGWSIIQISARNYYWVGGSGKWSEFDTHWSNSDGGSQFFDSSPGPLDNVFFTSSSFPSGGALSLDFPASVNNMDWTGSTSLVSITDLGEFENSLTIGGDFILANGVSRDFEDLFLISNNTGNTIYTADNLSGFNYIQITGNGEWSLAGPLNSYYLFMISGGFNTNDFDVDATLIQLVNDNVSNWGSSNVTTRRLYTQGLNSSSNFQSANSTFIFNEESQVFGSNRLFNVQVNADANFDDSNIIINAEVHNGTLALNANNAFSSLVVTDAATLSIAPATIQTVNLGLTIVGSAEAPITINSLSEGESGFITVPASGSVNASYVHLKDNTANSGGAVFNTTNSSDFGNVSGWTGLLAGQNIDFGSLSDQTLASGGFNVGASASSGLNVSFEIASGNASIAGSTVTPTTSGLIGVRAVQTGDATYGSSNPVIRYIHADATSDPEEIGSMKEARIAIGQPDPFANGRFYSETTTPAPWGAAVSSTGKLAIANGTRVLIWNQIPANYNVPADVVVGQADFTSDINAAASASSFYNGVSSVSFSSTDQMIVADGRGVLIFNSIPTTNGASADIIVGQSNFTTTRSGVNADRFADDLITATTYYNEGTGSESLFITDAENSRVLIYNAIPTSNGVSADLVIGQQDFTTKANGAAANQLNYPISTTIKDGQIFISEYDNHRVLVYNSIPTTNGASADFVLGQAGFGFSEAGTDATTFRGPTSTSVSRLGKLAITDYLNSRVLIYNTIPTSSSAIPDIVLGQPDMTSNERNYNSISGRTMNRPISVSWDISNNLFVADISNNRVLLYGAPDLIGPVIESSTIPTFHTVGSGNAGSLTISDRSGVMANIQYKGISSSSATDPNLILELVDNGSGTYSFNTNDLLGAGEELGIEFGFEIVDGYGNTSPISMETIPLQHPNGMSITNFGVGSTSENYKMFSIPLDLDNKSVNTVFNSIISGTYDDEKLRVFSYPGGASANYTELSNNQNLELGKGYFALSSASASVTTGSGTTANVSASTPFETTLVPGWNMIGNPYNFNINWSDILTESAISGTQPGTPQGYNSGFADQATMSSGVGYFVNNPSSSNMVLKFPVENNSGGRYEGLITNTNPLSEDSWEVRFLETNDSEMEFLIGAVGMDPYSVESYDDLDQINPPAFSDHPVIDFNHNEFFQPSFKKDIRTTTHDQKWEFTYTALPGERKLHWDNSYYGTSSPEIYLVDKTHFKVINMKDEVSYSFDNTGITEFEVFFGENALEAIYPDRLITITPYPNPFTDETRINIGLPDIDPDSEVNVIIFNTVGMQIATLRTNANNNAYMEFLWRGTNDSGIEVPDGVYAFKVLVDGEISEFVTGKLIKN